jgi:uncharacterized membrane protein YcaP (DUF421 family)
MVASWLVSSWSTVGWIVVSGVLVVAATIAIVRLIGLRSLAKMSAFDFAVTVAIGSIIAQTVTTPTPVSDGVAAVFTLLAVQWIIAQLRRRSVGIRVVDNRPILLVRDGTFIDDALDSARITRSDIYGHLRKSNVHSMRDVLAVVLETTGDLSVVSGEGPLDPDLFDNVRQLDQPAGGD